MRISLRILFHKEGLSPEENIRYRNFNILLAVALLDIVFILLFLKDLEQRWPVQICLAELFSFIVLLILHIKGHLMFARYFTFLVALVVQFTACIIHGKTAGFDFIFYALAVLPMLFFHTRVHYLSLFSISIGTMLVIQYLYTLNEPLVIISGNFIYYWNIFFTASLILLVMYIFKNGYERNQIVLAEQHQIMVHQKEEIEGINNNLEQIIVDRTQRLKDQETRITHAAYLNAHKVRSPLARIIGLLNLIELEKNKSGVCEEYLPALRSNAEELNEMLKEVSMTLSDISSEKNHFK